MTSPKRLCEKVLGTLEFAIYRYRMGKEFFSDQDWLTVGAELRKLDMDCILRVIDRNHIAYLRAKTDNLPDSIYEIVNDKKLARKGVKNART